MAKFLITTIQANLCRRFTNSPELLLLKILPLSDHHSYFWAATFDFTTFFMLLFFAWAAPFFTVWLFWCRLYIAGQTDFVMHIQFAMYAMWQFSDEDHNKIMTIYIAFYSQDQVNI